MKELFIKPISQEELQMGEKVLCVAFRTDEDDSSRIRMHPAKLVFIDSETGEETEVKVCRGP